MINIVNRVDNSDLTVSSNSPNMRFWSPDFVLDQVTQLAELGVSRLRLSDEMFFLNQRYFEPLLNGIIERNLDMHMWSYTRVDTARDKYLDLFRRAGIEWLGVGIEAGNREIRREVSKGTFKVEDISQVTRTLQASGMNIAANYIFGLPDDDFASMQQTLDLALDLCTEFANFYPCQALPGSPLHLRALQEGWNLPKDFSGYAFLSYDSEPLRTKHLTSAQVLEFRDKAWLTYFTDANYLDLVEKKFGPEQRKNIQDLSRIRLQRKLLESN